MKLRNWIAIALACSLVASFAGAADRAPVTLGGQTYEFDGDTWYQVDDGRRFPVEPGIVTIGLGDGVGTLAALRDALLANGENELAALPLVRGNRLGIQDLQLLPSQDVIEIAQRFEATGLVRFAEPPTIGTWTVTPNDTRFTDQWHLRNTGQSGGTPDADIDADDAWDVEAGDSSAVVGVLDSGTDIDHSDFDGNLWKNLGETPSNGRDDDNNGFVDDYDGWNFEAGTGNPRSTNGHGTQVGGIVAARTDNGIGVSGVAGGIGGSSGALVMPVKVGTGGPIGSILDDAILYALDNGADIITMSLTVGQSAAINSALQAAWDGGVFIDCASGNGNSSVAYPANNTNVMAVGSTGRTDNRSSFSNFGSNLEVVAPGESIVSLGLNGSTTSGSGTSFAAPCVAGVAALMISKNPTISNDTIRQTLKDTADDVGVSGFDNQTGWGRINARAAVDAVPPAQCIDADNDGFFPISGCNSDIDCDDSDPDTYPGAPEVCNDGVDQDCDGVDKTKGKGCGGGGGSGGGGENCKNGVDDDGDGLVDCLDGDCSNKGFCR